jgi:hypothetical protein
MNTDIDFQLFLLLKKEGDAIKEQFEVIYNKVAKYDTINEQKPDYGKQDIFKMHIICTQFVKSVLTFDKYINCTKVQKILSGYIKLLFSNKPIVRFLLIDNIPDCEWKTKYMTYYTIKNEETHSSTGNCKIDVGIITEEFSLTENYKKTYQQNIDTIYKEFFKEYFKDDEMPEIAKELFVANNI